MNSKPAVEPVSKPQNEGWPASQRSAAPGECGISHSTAGKCDRPAGRWSLLLTLCALFALATTASLVRADDAPTYEKHVAPFLKAYCVGCHDGGDDSKGGLSLLSHQSLMAGGDGGEAIVPGKSDESRLIQMLLGTEPPKMPPKDARQPKPEEIALVKRWVDLGAKPPAVTLPQSADELALPKITPKFAVTPAVTAVRYSADGRWLAAARHRDVLVIDAETGAVARTLTGAENPINAVAFSPDGKLLAAAEGLPSVVGKVRVWNLTDREEASDGTVESKDAKVTRNLRTLTGHTDSIYALSFSPDGTQLVTSSYDKLLILWDVATGSPKHTLKHHTAAVFGLAYSPDGKALASVSADQTVKLWNVTTGQRILTLIEPTKSLNAVAFHPQGRELAAAGSDKMIRVYDWNGTTAKLKRSAFAHDAAVLALAYSPDGSTLYSAGEDRRIKAWDASALQERHVYDQLPDWPLTLAVSPSGNRLATGLFNGALLILDARTPKTLNTVTTASLPPRSRGGQGGAVGTIQDSGFRIQGIDTFHTNMTTFFSLPPSRGKGRGWGGERQSTHNPSPARVESRRRKPSLPRFEQWYLHISQSGDKQELLAPFSPRGRRVGDEGANADQRPSSPSPPAPLPSRERGEGIVDAHRLAHRDEPGSLPAPFGWILAAAIGQQQEQPPAAAEEPKPNPPTPRLDAVGPRTVVRGQKVKFTLTGPNIADAKQILVSKKELTAKLLPADPKNANQALCEIEIPADLPIGNVSLRLHTPLGTAGSKAFYVGPFLETGEKEENNAHDKATPATLPATLVGTIDRRGDRDFWSVEARAGEQLVFVLVASSLGSSLQARVTLTDESGRVLATAVRQPERTDVVIGHKFVSTGRAFLQIDDRDNSGSGNHFYVVHAGAFPWVTGVWPLALRGSDQGAAVPGEVTELGVLGFNLLPETKLRPIPGAATRNVAPFTPEGRTLNTVRYEASPFPEFAEREPSDTPARAHPLPIPSAVSGRIAPRKQDSGIGIQDSGTNNLPSRSRGSQGGADPQSTAPTTTHPSPLTPDHYSFTAKRGDRLTIEAIASRIGSPLDTVIDILDAEGHPVPRNTLRAVAETYIVLRDHDSRGKGIRLQNWDDLQPNDFVMVGGEVLRVQSLPLGPDADVQFADRNGRRMGWFGTTPEAHAINTAAFKVEIHPPGAAFPPNGMPVVPLYWRSDDAPGLGTDSEVLFDVPADGTYVVRVRDVRDLAGDDFVYRLVIRPRHEDFRISLDPDNPNIPRGGSLPVTVNLDRLEGFTGPVDVRLEGLPEGITATTTRIGPHKFSGILTLTAPDSFPPCSRGGQGGASEGVQPPAATDKSPSTTPPLRVIGRASIADQPVEHSTNPGFGNHQVTVTSPPDIRITVVPSFAEISPGQELRFTATIERRNAFKGRVPVEVLNLPHGLRVLDVGLNGVLINENETSRSFVVTCDPWAEPGPVTFYAAARVEAKNERHASAPLRLEVKSAPTVAGK